MFSADHDVGAEAPASLQHKHLHQKQIFRFKDRRCRRVSKVLRMKDLLSNAQSVGTLFQQPLLCQRTSKATDDRGQAQVIKLGSKGT